MNAHGAAQIPVSQRASALGTEAIHILGRQLPEQRREVVIVHGRAPSGSAREGALAAQASTRFIKRTRLGMSQDVTEYSSRRRAVAKSELQMSNV